MARHAVCTLPSSFLLLVLSRIFKGVAVVLPSSCLPEDEWLNLLLLRKHAATSIYINTCRQTCDDGNDSTTLDVCRPSPLGGLESTHVCLGYTVDPHCLKPSPSGSGALVPGVGGLASPSCNDGNSATINDRCTFSEDAIVCQGCRSSNSACIDVLKIAFDVPMDGYTIPGHDDQKVLPCDCG